MKRKNDLPAGIAAPAVFWLTTIVCGLMMGNYNHLVRLVSELGALGTDTRFIFAVGLVLTGILSLALMVGLLRRCKSRGVSIFPVIIILTHALSITGAGIFPMPTRLHGLLGMPSVLMPLSPLLSLWLWRNGTLPYLKTAAVISFILMMLGFLVYFPDLLAPWMGLKQRFFHLGWSLWFVYLSLGFGRK